MKTYSPFQSRESASSSRQHKPSSFTSGAFDSPARQQIREILNSGIIQPKLEIGAPDSECEREADKVAEMVMCMPEHRENPGTGTSKTYHNENQNTIIQPKANASANGISDEISTEIGLLKNSGKTLPAAELEFFENRMNSDFGNVRIHTDAKAAEMARAVHAKAFTFGSNIAFSEGKYSPESLEGKKLLAHELAHVVQQNRKGNNNAIQRVNETRDWKEEAKRLKLSELDTAIKNLRELLEYHSNNPEMVQELTEQLSAYENEFGKRQEPLIAQDKETLAVREMIKTPVKTLLNTPVAPASIEMLKNQSAGLFVTGLARGFVAELPAGKWDECFNELSENKLSFLKGLYLGEIIGLHEGIVNFINGTWDIMKLLYHISPVGIVSGAVSKAVEYFKDPEQFDVKTNKNIAAFRSICKVLIKFEAEFSRDPTVICAMSSDLGVVTGIELADILTEDFFDKSPSEKGEYIGNILGQILFEVLSEIIIAATTAFVGNVIKGGQKGGKIAQKFHEILNSSDTFKKLLGSLPKAEDAKSVVKIDIPDADHHIIDTSSRLERTIPDGSNILSDTTRIPLPEEILSENTPSKITIDKVIDLPATPSEKILPPEPVPDSVNREIVDDILSGEFKNKAATTPPSSSGSASHFDMSPEVQAELTHTNKVTVFDEPKSVLDEIIELTKKKDAEQKELEQWKNDYPFLYEIFFEPNSTTPILEGKMSHVVEEISTKSSLQNKIVKTVHESTDATANSKAEKVLFRKYANIANDYRPYYKLKNDTQSINRQVREFYGISEKDTEYIGLRLDADHIIEARLFKHYASEFRDVGIDSEKKMIAIAVHTEHHIRSGKGLKQKFNLLEDSFLDVPSFTQEKLVAFPEKNIRQRFPTLLSLVEAYENFYKERPLLWQRVAPWFKEFKKQVRKKGL